MSEIDRLREYFEEEPGEKRKTIFGLKFFGGHSTSIEVDLCTLEEAVGLMDTMEREGLIIACEKHSPCHHTGSHAKDVAFRHPPHTIEYIEIIRRRQWKEENR